MKIQSIFRDMVIQGFLNLGEIGLYLPNFFSGIWDIFLVIGNMQEFSCDLNFV